MGKFINFLNLFMPDLQYILPFLQI